VMPEGTRLDLLFGMDGGAGRGEEEASWGRADAEVLLLIAVGGQHRRHRPGIWVDTGEPVVAVEAGFGVGIEVVAEGPPPGDGVVVGSDVNVLEAEAVAFPVHVSAGAEARDFGRAHRGAVRRAQDVAK